MTTTIANNPDTGGTFTQPVPYSDGQAGHFEQSGGLGNTVPAGGLVGVGDGWYSYNLGSGTLSRLISSARRSRAAVRTQARGLPPNSHG